MERIVTDSGFAEVNGARLYYECAGVGEALVLVHGFTLDNRMWDDQFEIFARHFRVVRYDLRGFGRSAVPDETAYVHADDLSALLTYLNIERAHVMGLSMGGGITLDFALLHPQRVLSLILVDSTVGGYPFTTRFHYEARSKGIAYAKQYWLAHDLFKASNENPQVAAKLKQIVDDYSGWHWVNNDTDEFPLAPAIDHLREINARTLVILGERDIVDFHGVADVLVQHMPCATKAIMPNVGHMSNMEAPDAFNQIALSFLMQVE